MTPHIESTLQDIASIVLMPGDPLRAKYIADNYLKDVKVVNRVRNMTAYTGYYKDKLVTIFPSGMGIPSMGIYAYELYKFYNVEKIIRIGTCGSGDPSVKVLDVVLATSSYSTSNFAKLFFDSDKKEYYSTQELNDLIGEKSHQLNLNIHRGRIITSDVFDVYVDHEKFMSNFPNQTYLAAEMEGFALFSIAEHLNKSAACLLTVVDSKYQKDIVISSEQRQTSLNDMIKLALESII